MPLVVVLADLHDRLAVRVTSILRRRGVPVRVVTPLELGLGAIWVHRVDSDGAGTTIRLPDGTSLEGDIAAILNRLHGSRFFPERIWTHPRDALYAEAELGALVTSWLESVSCPVYGPPPSGLLHDQMTPLELMTRAMDAGLPVRRMVWATDASAVDRRRWVALDPFVAGRELSPAEAYVLGKNPVVLAEPLSELTRVFVIDGRVCGAPEGFPSSALVRLAQSLPCRLLACDLGRTASREPSWVFCGATATPDDADAEAVTALADALWAVAPAPA